MEAKSMTGQLEIITEVRGGVGFITLNRPGALNALNLSMIRALTACLLGWRDDPQVQAVAIRGSNKAGVFGAFCAGGDIRYFHQALLAGDPSTEDFFTEEYTLNHLVHRYPKPYIAFMDGVVMGGGMGISQGASHRLVTPRSKLAMPETLIGLFPDVGGGYFLSRCPGQAGEWLALTGTTLVGDQAIALGLADHCVDAADQARLWDALAVMSEVSVASLNALIASFAIASGPINERAGAQFDACFSEPTVKAIAAALAADGSDDALATLALLRARSPLMLHVTLEQIRRARHMTLAQDLRMERDLVRHCFYTQHLDRSGAQTETAEGIRALVIDKDNAPRWYPASIEEVTPDMVEPFFVSPWPEHAHPLNKLT